MTTNNEHDSGDRHDAEIKMQIERLLLPQEIMLESSVDIRKQVKTLMDDIDNLLSPKIRNSVEILFLRLKLGRCVHELQRTITDGHFIDYICETINYDVTSIIYLQQCQFMYECREASLPSPCLDGDVEFLCDLLDKCDERNLDKSLWLPQQGNATSLASRAKLSAVDIGPFKAVDLDQLCIFLLKHGITTTAPKSIYDFLTRDNLPLQDVMTWLSCTPFQINKSDRRVAKATVKWLRMQGYSVKPFVEWLEDRNYVDDGDVLLGVCFGIQLPALDDPIIGEDERFISCPECGCELDAFDYGVCLDCDSEDDDGSDVDEVCPDCGHVLIESECPDCGFDQFVDFCLHCDRRLNFEDFMNGACKKCGHVFDDDSDLEDGDEDDVDDDL